MKIFRSKLIVIAIAIPAILISSCARKGCTHEIALNYDEKAKEDDGSCEYGEDEDANTINHKGAIVSDEVWSANKIHLLDGRVWVESGATLTIDPGTIIKGKKGSDQSASALIIARGAKIMAEGSAAEPIVFTTEFDDIEIGQVTGSNLDRKKNERWGGLAILGGAPISAENGDKTTNLEGVPSNESYGKFGGDDIADNSGKLSYVSIRHGGISIGEGNELNGLTLAGVGNGTTISNIEIYATLDDGVECFGGSVDISNLLVYYQGDDGIDLDMSYSGTISNFAVIQGDDIGTDEGLEIDGPEGVSNLDGKFTLTNGLIRHLGSEGSPADFKSDAQGSITNVTFETGAKDIKFRTKFESACTNKDDAYKNVTTSDLNFSGISSAGATIVYDGSVKGPNNPELPADSECPSALSAAQSDILTRVNTGGAGSNIDIKTLFSWTVAAIRDELNP